MASRSNPQSCARRRAGRNLMEIIEHYQLDVRQIAKDTGIDLITLQNLRTFTPHLHTIERISVHLQQVARERTRATSPRGPGALAARRCTSSLQRQDQSQAL